MGVYKVKQVFYFITYPSKSIVKIGGRKTKFQTLEAEMKVRATHRTCALRTGQCVTHWARASFVKLHRRYALGSALCIEPVRYAHIPALSLCA